MIRVGLRASAPTMARVFDRCPASSSAWGSKAEQEPTLGTGSAVDRPPRDGRLMRTGRL